VNDLASVFAAYVPQPESMPLRDSFVVLFAAAGLFLLFLLGRCLRHLPEEFIPLKGAASEETP
jgi:hypothetical protein